MSSVRSMLVQVACGALVAVAHCSDAVAFQSPTTFNSETAKPAATDTAHYALTGLIPGVKGRMELVTSPTPFDQTYDELTAGQKSAFRDLFPMLPQDTEPPFPQSGLKNLSTALIDISHRLVSPASFDAYLSIDSQGNPTSIMVVQSSDTQLTQSVGLALLKQKFKPASCHGQPCEMQYPVRLQFAAGAGIPSDKFDASIRTRPEFQRAPSDPVYKR